MDFIDQIKVLAAKIPSISSNIKTEEATKNALVMPLLNILGYNMFDPLEVVPEFTTDYGTKKGKKVDYAVFRDGKPVILIECKSVDFSISYFTNFPYLLFEIITLASRIIAYAKGYCPG